MSKPSIDALLELVKVKFDHYIPMAEWRSIDSVPESDCVTRSGDSAQSPSTFNVLVVRHGEQLLRIPWYVAEPRPAILLTKIGETSKSWELLIFADSAYYQCIIPGPNYGQADIPMLIQQVEKMLRSI